MSEFYGACVNARESATINESLYGPCEQWEILLSCITGVAPPPHLQIHINATKYLEICFSSYASKYCTR